WWSGTGDDLRNTLGTEVDLSGAASASLSMKAHWDIEAGYDHAYVQASTDGGETWTALDGTVDGAPFGRDPSNAPALSGKHDGGADAVAQLEPHLGASVRLRLLYSTGGGTSGRGFFADDMTVTVDGKAVVDGGEEGTRSWEPDGFSSTTGTEVT